MTGRRVLIAHAAGLMRKIVKSMLIDNGYEVVGEAANGREAVEKYRSLLPDVVTMDMVMPEMDGIAAVKAIVSEFPQAKIIMCTSPGQLPEVVEVLHAGAKSFITKPFHMPKIVAAIEKVLA